MTVMQDLQVKFQQFFFDERRPIASVTMTEADYEALLEEVMPQEQWTVSAEREKRLTKLDPSKYRVRGITKILDKTDGNLVQIIRDPTLARGTFILNGA